MPKRTIQSRSKKSAAKTRPAIDDLIEVMARLRSPTGCPWDQEQDHMSLRYHAVEEVYELMDAIESGDDSEMLEELGDLLLQVVFHCQMASERKVFGFEQVTRNLVDKLVRRHPHVFGDAQVRDVDAVWAQWEKIKHAEKKGTVHDRPSALDGIPRHLPALLRAEKLVKKARKAGLAKPGGKAGSRQAIACTLFDLAAQAQAAGWSAEALLSGEIQKRDAALRRSERAKASRSNKA